MNDPIRVMLVDDSSVVRGLIRRTLEADSAIEIVASLADGQAAVNWLSSNSADVVVLDIEMPRMDGITALPKMIKLDPRIQVVMASTLTERNADISLKALQLGAKDYVPKPTSNRDMVGANDFGTELLAKVKGLGLRHPRRGARGAALAAEAAAAPRPAPRTGIAGPAAPRLAPGPRIDPSAPPKPTPPTPTRKPLVLAIGSSTGGPAALFDLLGTLKKIDRVPLFITQHMPPTFTPILAKHITERTTWECAEARDGEVVQPGRAYLAPGNYHLLVDRQSDQLKIRLDQGPLENFCRPAVDPMLRSLVQAYGPRVLVTILTGMGHDGMAGSRHVVDAGGEVLAQDQVSSVVWGMPGAVAKEGLCRLQGTPQTLAQEMRKAFDRMG